MIRIVKPIESPTILVERGVSATNTLCAEYDGGKRHFPTRDFDDSIYSHSDVRQALDSAQHGKCAFCESLISAEEGDIEHYRPKAAVKQERSGALLRPGYYWLAYEWENLLLSCKSCNGSRNKGNLFPLADPEKRARCHTDDLSDEEPLLIHPALKNPGDHIAFVEEMAEPRDEYGRATITVLRLNNRRALRISRLNRYQELMRLCDLLELESELSDSPRGRRVLQAARDESTRAISDDAEFVAMSMATIAGRGMLPAR